MGPIVMPGEGASSEQVIAFLSHQLQAAIGLVQAKDETETQICARLQAQMDKQVEAAEDDFRVKVAAFRNDARRYGILRKSLVKCRELRISAKGIELDIAIDRHGISK